MSSQFAHFSLYVLNQMQNVHLSRIPLFPLHQGLFPDGLLQLTIFEVRYLDLIRQCEASKSPFGVAIITAGSEIETAGSQPVLCDYGTMATIESLTKPQPYLFKVICKGGTRFLMNNYEQGKYGVWYGHVIQLEVDPVAPIPAHLQHLADKLGRIIANLQRDGQATRLPFGTPYKLDECGWVANRLAELLALEPAEKHALLAEDNPIDRLQAVAAKMVGSKR
jgi:uncharacterized protein